MNPIQEILKIASASSASTTNEISATPIFCGMLKESVVCDIYLLLSI